MSMFKFGEHPKMCGKDVRVGDVIMSGQRQWGVTAIGDPIPHDRNGMFVLYVEPRDGGPERHKPLHTNPDSQWHVRRPSPPPSSDAAAGDTTHNPRRASDG